MKHLRRLDHAERWLRDGVDICRVPAFFETLDIDMTNARAEIEEFRRRGIRLTYVHLIVHAAARAMAAHPDLHQLVCGGKVYKTPSVRIALSVAGEMPVAPLLIVRDAEQKTLPAIVEEIARRVPEVRAADQKLISLLRRWGWLVPAGFLRRAILRTLFRNAGFRIEGSGTLQVSVLSRVEMLMSPLFSTSAALFAGAVTDRVVAVDGTAVVRPIMTIACSADHRIWDGRAGERFLIAVRDILQSNISGFEFNSIETCAQGAKAAVF